MQRILILLTVLILTCFSTSLMAQIPRVINYQGMLLGSDEQPVAERDYQITFNLYDESDNLLWSEVHNKVFIGGGMFHVLLGTVSPLNLPFDKPYLLGIQVENDPELQPRMMMTSAAYSFNADKVGGIRASTTPEPNVLYPLDSNGKFPASVLPAGGPSGDFLKKNEPDTSLGTDTSPMLLISNLGNGDGINGRSTNGRGVEGRSDNETGVQGWTGTTNKSGVFGHSTDGIGVTGRSTNNYGVLAHSENLHSIYVPGAGSDGVFVASANRYGVHVESASFDGVYVNSADRHGFTVGSATFDGLSVNQVSGNGVQIKDAGHDGLRVRKAGMNGLRIYENVTGNYIYAGSDADADFRVSNDGTAYADGGWQGAADFAELIETDGLATGYEPGDVLVISNDKDRAVTLSSKPYSTGIIGVYSTKPGFVGSTHPMENKYDNEIPVAITGIVPCKASTENGPIRRGDLLTSSSTPGYAMKATEHKVGTILCKAMETLDSGMGKIEVLIILQ